MEMYKYHTVVCICMTERRAKDGSTYPDCPNCKTNTKISKNGRVERNGEVFQVYRCGGCGKTW